MAFVRKTAKLSLTHTHIRTNTHTHTPHVHTPIKVRKVCLQGCDAAIHTLNYIWGCQKPSVSWCMYECVSLIARCRGKMRQLFITIQRRWRNRLSSVNMSLCWEFWSGRCCFVIGGFQQTGSVVLFGNWWDWVSGRLGRYSMVIAEQGWLCSKLLRCLVLQHTHTQTHTHRVGWESTGRWQKAVCWQYLLAYSHFSLSFPLSSLSPQFLLSFSLSLYLSILFSTDTYCIKRPVNLSI